MRKIYTLVVSVFVVIAALLGWFLPLAYFNVNDKFYEGKQASLDIEQINLSYRDDMSMNQKINIINYEYYLAEAIEIDKGIFIQEDEIKQIMSDFVSDFAGYKIDVSKRWKATPNLVNLSNRGTIVIWEVQVWLNNSWKFECLLDDKTGAILSCEFRFDYYDVYTNEYSDYDPDWNNLIPDIENDPEFSKTICERFGNALYNHYSKQLSAKLISYTPVTSWADVGSNGIRLVFRDSKNYTFGISVKVVLDEYTLSTF